MNLAPLLDRHSRGDFAGLEAEARALLRSHPRQPLLLNALGISLVGQRRFDAALLAFGEAVAADPNFADAYSNMGNVQRTVGRLDEAIESYGRAIAARPDYAEARSNLAVTLKDKGDDDLAYQAFRLALLLKPSLAEGHYNLALLLDRRSRPEAALAGFRRSIALSRESGAAQNGLASILLRQGRLAHANRAQKRAIAIAPGFADAHNGFGMLQKRIGRREDALGRYRRALAIDPLHAETCNNLGAVFHDLGAVGPTVAMYARAVALAPAFEAAIYNLGVALHETNRLDRATTYFDRFDIEDAAARSLHCSYKTRHTADFERRLSKLLKKKHVLPLVANLSAHYAANFRTTDPYGFCPNPLEFVYQAKIEALAPPSSQLRAALLRDITSSTISERQQGHLYEGVQSSGFLFERPETSFRELAAHVLDHVDRYVARHRGDGCTFITEFPAEKRFLGSWFIRMRKGGHLTSHIHESGWLSGVVYVSVPRERAGNEGNIEFSIDGDGYPADHTDFPSRVVPIETGDIVLFPSSLFHRTIAFDSAEERICIAFDIAPGALA